MDKAMPLLLLIGAAIVCAVNDSAELPPSGKLPWCEACEKPDKHAAHDPSGINCSQNPANQYVEVCDECGQNCKCFCVQCKFPGKKQKHVFTSLKCDKFDKRRNVLQPGIDPPDVLEFEQDGRQSSIKNPKVKNKRKRTGSQAKPPPPAPHSSAPAAMQGERERVRAKEDSEPTRPKNKRKRVEEQQADVQVVHPEPDAEPEEAYMFKGLPYNELHPGERPWPRQPPLPHQDSRVSIAHNEVAEFLSAIRARLDQATDTESSNDRLSWAIWFWNLQRDMQTTDILYAINQYVEGNVPRAFLKQRPQEAREELMSVLREAWDTLWQSFVTNHDAIHIHQSPPTYEADLVHVFVQQQIRDSLSWLVHLGPPGIVRAGIKQRSSDERNQVPHIRGPNRFQVWHERMLHLAPEETRFLSCRHWFPRQQENTTAQPTPVASQRIPPEETEIPRTDSPLATNVEDGLFRPSFADRVCSMHDAPNDSRQPKRKAPTQEPTEEAPEVEEPSEQPKAGMEATEMNNDMHMDFE